MVSVLQEIDEARCLKLEKIFVIGDSHVNFFGGHEQITFIPILNKLGQPTGINNCGDIIENFITLHLGPALAYNLNRYNTKNLTREKIDLLLNSGVIGREQNIMCAFGEIDCRVHVLRQAERQKVNFKVVIDSILEQYLIFLKFLSQQHNVWVWGPIPSQKDNSPINPEYPYYGSEADRNIATEYFNQKLKEMCLINGIKFFSIFRDLIDRNYKTKSQFIADGCHLSQKAWILAADELAKGGGQNII